VNNAGISVPSVTEIVGPLLDAEVRHDGQHRPQRQWVEEDRRQAYERRQGDPSAIFPRFAAAILERNVTGTSYRRRVEAFERGLGDPKALTPERAEALLRESGYRYPPQGAKTLLAVMKRLTEPGFSWAAYFAQAEANWETGFETDDLLKIKGVGPKTRDFALSEFSDYFCAPDLHVCRMLARTGLLLRGYGDPAISTSDYGFMRRLMQTLARDTGWPEQPDGLSPSHLDRIYWFYGQDRARCSAKPGCGECPASRVCLTGLRGRQ
jgi:endonuclease III